MTQDDIKGRSVIESKMKWGLLFRKYDFERACYCSLIGTCQHDRSMIVTHAEKTSFCGLTNTVATIED